MVAIPASLIATFIGMYLLGYTLNLMSLLALSLVVGILVDDAIVVLENIYRHMEMGKNRVRAAYDATKEIGFTVTSITLVIVVVFVPIALSTGLAANIIKSVCRYRFHCYFIVTAFILYHCTLAIFSFWKT
jgi:Cation/multidrug efflux pump